MSIAIGMGARSVESGPESQTQTLEIIAPFLPRAVLNELCTGRVFEEYRRRRLERFKAATVRAIWEQQQMAREMSQVETKMVNGLGQHRMIVHPLLHAIAERKWGKGCWQDKGFRKHTLDRSPELRVPAPARRLVQVDGFRDERKTND